MATVTNNELDARRIGGETSLIATNVRKQLELVDKALLDGLPMDVITSIVKACLNDMKRIEEKNGIIHSLLNPSLQESWDFGEGKIVNPGPISSWTIHTHIGEKYKKAYRLVLTAVNSVDEFVKILYDKHIVTVDGNEFMSLSDLNKCFIKNLGICKTGCGETNFIDFFNFDCPCTPLYHTLVIKDRMVRRDSALLFGLLYYKYIHIRQFTKSLVIFKSKDKKESLMRLRGSKEVLTQDYFRSETDNKNPLPDDLQILMAQVECTVKQKTNEALDAIKLLAKTMEHFITH